MYCYLFVVLGSVFLTSRADVVRETATAIATGNETVRSISSSPGAVPPDTDDMMDMLPEGSLLDSLPFDSLPLKGDSVPLDLTDITKTLPVDADTLALLDDLPVEDTAPLDSVTDKTKAVPLDLPLEGTGIPLGLTKTILPSDIVGSLAEPDDMEDLLATASDAETESTKSTANSPLKSTVSTFETVSDGTDTVTKTASYSTDGSSAVTDTGVPQLTKMSTVSTPPSPGVPRTKLPLAAVLGRGRPRTPDVTKINPKTQIALLKLLSNMN